MSENALVPYRTQALSPIEPIDRALVPDCGRSEKTRLEKEIDATERGLAVYRDRVLDRAFGKIFPVMFGLAALICICVGCAYPARYVVVCAIISLFLSFQAAGALSENVKEKWLPADDEEARLLEVRSVDQERRLEKLKSLMRLTGSKGEGACKLQAEIQSFNSDIDGLDMDECTVDERALILERRREILARIKEFRQKVLESPPVPPLLTAGPDDRT